MIQFILRALVAGLGFLLASRIVYGVHVDGVTSLVEAGLVLGVLNAVVRPILVLLTLPLSIMTLGLFLLVVNGVTVWLVTAFVHGIHIYRLWPATLAAVVISMVSWLANFVIGGLDNKRYQLRSTV
jgi:putative membrane protein